MLETTEAEARERARRTLRETADDAREELGRVAFDVLEERFPEEADARREPDYATPLLVGFAAGVLFKHLLER